MRDTWADRPGVQDVTTLDNPRALPSFVGKLVAAFRGAVVPAAAGPLPGRDQVGSHRADPSRVWPVRTSQFGAPSSQARPVIENLPEYANFRQPLSGEIFVSNPAIYNRVIRRRMAAPPIARALVPSRAATYRAPMYVSGQAAADAAATATSPASRLLGGR